MLKKILISIAIILLILVGFGFYFYNDSLKPISNDNTIQLFEVTSGQGINDVLEKLEKEGYIKNAFIAKLYVKQNKINNTYKGKFQLSKSMSTPDILKTVTDKKNIYIEYISIDIIPGKWAKDYAAEIEKKTGLKKDDVLKKWNDDSYLKQLIGKFSVLSDDILNDQTRVKLEGYFAPDTYKIDKEKLSIELITETLLQPTQKFYEENKSLFDKNSLSKHQVFTLASIVQFESANRPARPEYGPVTEQQLVASVFLNRLKINQKLQSSVTVCYALYDYGNDWKQCELQIHVNSPYNTYVVKGLPVGPVTNPTKAALLAVLKPIESKYFFFVADVYNNTGTYFSETYEQHNALVKKLLKR